MALWMQHLSHLSVLEFGERLPPDDQSSWDLISQCIAVNRRLEVLRIHVRMTDEIAARIVGWIKSKNHSSSTPSPISAPPCLPIREIGLVTFRLASRHIQAILDAGAETLQRCILQVEQVERQGFRPEETERMATTTSVAASGSAPDAVVVAKYPNLQELSMNVYDPWERSMSESCFWSFQFPIWQQSPNMTTFHWPPLSIPHRIRGMIEFFEKMQQQQQQRQQHQHQQQQPVPIELMLSHFMRKRKHYRYISRIISACAPHSIHRLNLGRNMNGTIARVIASTQCHSLKELHLDYRFLRLANYPVRTDEVIGLVLTYEREEDEDDEDDDEDQEGEEGRGSQQRDDEIDKMSPASCLQIVLDACPNVRVIPRGLSSGEPSWAYTRASWAWDEYRP
ncbi:hypothetical protein DFQ27_007951 [Actinomortierella ambigua]|uniref:Uncharacterized protein n=1 Tax=Actinomortierella ambigua TaxID=1343610 RepID=A0A9P6TZF6_9FUNG|nr:hypothetical protein DFQ27_007951 [Actinomortierella ambigua]